MLGQAWSRSVPTSSEPPRTEGHRREESRAPASAAPLGRLDGESGSPLYQGHTFLAGPQLPLSSAIPHVARRPPSGSRAWNEGPAEAEHGTRRWSASRTPAVNRTEAKDGRRSTHWTGRGWSAQTPQYGISQAANASAPLTGRGTAMARQRIW
jgi:hypothetical protein